MDFREKAMLKGMKEGVAIRIADLEREVERLREEKADLKRRMTSARKILTKGNPTWDRNWGILDVTDYDQTTTPEGGEVDDE